MPCNEPVGVLVADNSAPYLTAAVAVVELARGFGLVGTATTGEGAVAAARKLRPDLVLLDFRMPGLDGIEVAARIVGALPAAVVLLMSVSDTLPDRWTSSGARAVVRKS